MAKAKLKVVEPEIIEQIPQASLVWNDGRGQMFGAAVVMLPRGMTINYMRENPTCWRSIQSNANSKVSVTSTVTVIEHDRSKFIHSWVVEHADDTTVIIAPNRGGVHEVTEGAFWGAPFGVYNK